MKAALFAIGLSLIVSAASSLAAESCTDSDPSCAKQAQELYRCPMHPEITSETAGATCPKCGMGLEKDGPKKDHGETHSTDNGSHSGHKH